MTHYRIRRLPFWRLILLILPPLIRILTLVTLLPALMAGLMPSRGPTCNQCRWKRMTLAPLSRMSTSTWKDKSMGFMSRRPPKGLTSL